MNMAEIRTRLVAETMPPLRLVELVGSMPAARGQAAGVPQSPAAFLTLLGEEAQPNRYATGAHAQTIQTRFGVLLAVRDVSDAKGAAASEALDAVRETVISALAGWKPASVDETIEFRRGSLIDIANGVSWWLDEFGTSYEFEGE